MSYGACAATLVRAGTAPGTKLSVPIFLENPDGSITEAIPSHMKAAHKSTVLCAMADDSDDSNGNHSDAAVVNMYQEVEYLYSRHTCMFMVLLLAHLSLETIYDVVYVMSMDAGVVEFRSMYNYRITPKAAVIILWVFLGMELAFSLAYYTFAALAIWTRQPKYYQQFATISLAGWIGLVFMAYVSKFNLPLFFLRLLAYIYAQFLQSLSASLLLLPPGQGGAAAGTLPFQSP